MFMEFGPDVGLSLLWEWGGRAGRTYLHVFLWPNLAVMVGRNVKCCWRVCTCQHEETNGLLGGKTKEGEMDGPAEGDGEGSA